MRTILEIQQEIIGECSGLNGEVEKILFYLIQQGKQLPAMPLYYKTEAYLIKGCHSKVWLATVSDKEQVYLYADSNTAITKGLISLLIRILNGQFLKAVEEADISFMQGSGLERFIGSERSNGFAAMINQIKDSTNKLAATHMLQTDR
ncbi:SufE family protein [Rhodocytophaga rosea]|uniref:SufE family protein n=1 Tax=Rhodocytophaga rosea TaxID=2704465 RepID=A0A6C0GLB8_9BACT|nr:SufE family protein [Rhodocytophaga rosea]QHT68808.1 SufE family protein [Rhodocytophaga rosea]